MLCKYEPRWIWLQDIGSGVIDFYIGNLIWIVKIIKEENNFVIKLAATHFSCNTICSFFIKFLIGYNFF
jgi:hypothetical protein